MPRVTGAYSPRRSQDPVKIYENTNRGGDSASFDRVGRFDISNDNTGVNNGSISSIEVTTGWKVEAMKAGKRPGDANNRIFTGYTASMPSGWNDIIDEIVISRTSAPAPAPAPASTTGQSPAPASTTGQSPAPASTEETMDISQYIWWGVGGFALCCCCCLIVLAMLISSKQKPRFSR